jgi:hypothetical protein
MEQKDLLTEYARNKANLKEGLRMRDEAKSMISTAKAYIDKVKGTVADAKTDLKKKDQELCKQSKDATTECKAAVAALSAEDPVAAKKQKASLGKDCASKRKAIKA